MLARGEFPSMYAQDRPIMQLCLGDRYSLDTARDRTGSGLLLKIGETGPAFGASHASSRCAMASRAWWFLPGRWLRVEIRASWRGRTLDVMEKMEPVYIDSVSNEAGVDCRGRWVCCGSKHKACCYAGAGGRVNARDRKRVLAARTSPFKKGVCPGHRHSWT